MPGPNLSRDKDILDLRILDMKEGDGLGGTEIGRRVGLSKNAVVGRLHRLKHEPLPCLCSKPKNRDGGMPRGWWK